MNIYWIGHTDEYEATHALRFLLAFLSFIYVDVSMRVYAANAHAEGNGSSKAGDTKLYELPCVSAGN